MGKFSDALQDFQRCLKLLKEDNTSSLFPYEPDVSKKYLEQLRINMILIVGMDMGRAEIQFPENPKSRVHIGIRLIQQFIECVPSDTHYYIQAHYELLELRISE